MKDSIVQVGNTIAITQEMKSKPMKVTCFYCYRNCCDEDLHVNVERVSDSKDNK